MGSAGFAKILTEACQAAKKAAEASSSTAKNCSSIVNTLDASHKSYIDNLVEERLTEKLKKVEKLTGLILKPMKASIAKNEASLDALKVFANLTPDTQSNIVKFSEGFTSLNKDLFRLNDFCAWLQKNVQKQKKYERLKLPRPADLPPPTAR